MTNTNILQKWLELKNEEERIRSQRIELESQIVENYPVPDDKESATFHDDTYEINIKINKSYKPAATVQLPASCYKMTLNPTTTKKYAIDNPNAVVVTVNKPTITIRRTN